MIFDNWKPVLQRNYWSIIYFALLGLPICWAMRFDNLPLQDLPNHLANASILLNYHSSDFLRQYFELRFFPFPYLLQDLLLGGLLLIIPGYAANIFVALCIVALPCGFFYLNRTVNPDKPYLSFFSLPLIWNVILLKGNFNYLLGLALVFICLALLWRKLFFSQSEQSAGWVPLVLSIILLYLSHLVALMLFLVLAFIIVSYKLFGVSKYFYRFFVLFLAILAGSGILLSLIVSSRGNGLENILIDNFLEKLIEPANFVSFFHKGDCYFLTPYFIGMGLFLIISIFQFRKAPLSFLLIVTLFTIYWFVPSVIGPLVRPHDRVLFLLLALLPICFVNKKLLVFERIATPILCVAVFVLAYHYFTACGKALSPHITTGRNLLKQIPPEKKLLPVNIAVPYLYRIGVWNFIAAYYAVDGNGYVPCLASEKYMVVNYREKPEFQIYAKTNIPKQIGAYEYLIVWGHNEKSRERLAREGFVLVDSAIGYGLYKDER